jgi:hypothetical protein
MYDSASAGVWAAEGDRAVRTRGLIRLTAWSVLAGAVVNALIAQAIGCLNGDVFATPGTKRYLPIGGRCVCAQDWGGRGWRVLRWDIQDLDAAASDQYMYDHGLTFYVRDPKEVHDLHPDAPATLPTWAHFWDTANWVPDSTFGGVTMLFSTEECAVGWPVLSFSKNGDDRNFNTYRGGTAFARNYSPAIQGFTWRPMFPGVLWGSLLWAVPSALVISGARRMVRTLRRRRWQCPTCRYDLRGLPAGAVCPECGAPERTGSAPA